MDVAATFVRTPLWFSSNVHVPTRTKTKGGVEGGTVGDPPRRMGKGPAAVLPWGVAGRVCVVGLWIGLSPHSHLRLATSEGRGKVRLEKKGASDRWGTFPPPQTVGGTGSGLASNPHDRNRGRSSPNPRFNPRTRLHLPQRNTPSPPPVRVRPRDRDRHPVRDGPGERLAGRGVERGMDRKRERLRQRLGLREIGRGSGFERDWERECD